MTSEINVEHELQQFSGRAPLFPLPNVVHFPQTWLPLHIFEPRYRQMVSDALSGERLIAMALLRSSGELEYESKFAEIHSVVCLGRIAVEQRLSDGRFNLALRGLCRARVESELNEDLPYRTAKLTLLPDVYPHVATIDREHRHRELMSGAAEVLPELRSDPLLHQLIDADLPLGALCDVFGQALNLTTDDAQMLLEERDVDLRSDLVLHHLKMRLRHQAAVSKRGFPPAFSAN